MDANNFDNAAKRTRLNKCINKIYMIIGGRVPKQSNSAIFDKEIVRGVLNTSVLSSKRSTFLEAVNRVKRRLFIDDRPNIRKSATPKFNNQTFTEVGHFKPLRRIIGIKKIRRGFLNGAQQLTPWNLNTNQMLVERRLGGGLYFLNQQQSNERNSNYIYQIQNVSNNVENFYPNHTEFNGEYNAIPQPIQPIWYSCNNPDCLVGVNQNNTENDEGEQVVVQYYPLNNAADVEEPLSRQYYPPNNNQNDQNEQMEIQNYPHNDHDPNMEVDHIESDQLQAQYLQRMDANDKVTEASVRSMLYIRTLIGIISHQ